MAVLDRVPGLGVDVIVAGNVVAEYDDPSEADQERPACPTSTKYIECIDDAEFSIKVFTTNRYAWGYKGHILSVRVTVDGQHIRSPLLDSEWHHSAHVVGPESYCAITRQWSLRKLKFSAISTVDDIGKERLEKDMEIAKDLGLIKVEFRRCIDDGPGLSSSHDSRIQENDKLELTEKSLKGKAMSHGTSFSKRETVKGANLRKVVDLEEDYGPIAVFQFQYRSRDALKREMVLPRSPSPTFAQMPRAELERLARERLDQLQGGNIKEERKPAIKREFNGIIDLSDESARPSKSARRAVVIDLTDD